jgi:hypothetical protein
VGVIQLMPYHSTTKPPDRMIDRLQSLSLARRFVKDVLVQRALNDEALIIAARQVKRWDLPSGPNIVLYDRAQSRGAHLTPARKEIFNRLAQTWSGANLNKAEESTVQVFSNPQLGSAAKPESSPAQNKSTASPATEFQPRFQVGRLAGAIHAALSNIPKTEEQIVAETRDVAKRCEITDPARRVREHLHWWERREVYVHVAGKGWILNPRVARRCE